jgi:AcrR family transcriptional regulator
VTPRKRPLQKRSRATYEAILVAAAHILEERGLPSFNTNAVAERAGVSIGSLYQYFPSKDAILVSLMERSLIAFSEDMSQAIDGAPGDCLAEDLKFTLQMGIITHMRRPNLERLLESEFPRLEACLDRTSLGGAVRAAMIRLLERHRESIRPGDVAVMADDLGAIARTLMRAAGMRQETDREAVIDRTARAMVGYLGGQWQEDAR